MRFAPRLLPLLVALLVGLGAVPTAHAQTARVQGTVVDAQDQPVPNANVVLKPSDDGTHLEGVSAGADGDFVIRDLSAESYRLVVSAVGYTQTTNILTLDAG